VKDLAKLNGLGYKLNNKFVAQWMHTANDNTFASLSIQEAIAEEFGIELSDWQKGKLTVKKELFRLLSEGSKVLARKKKIEETQDYKNIPQDLIEDTVAIENEAVKYWNSIPDKDLAKYILWEQVRNFDNSGFDPDMHPLGDRGAERGYVKAVYENTQKYLSKLGYHPDAEITVFRGVRRDSESKKQINKKHLGEPVFYKGNAAESWSLSYKTAKGFGDVFAMKVPVKSIWSTARTGPGCLAEGEIIVLGNANVTCTPVYFGSQNTDND
jgi:hypothetical protein